MYDLFLPINAAGIPIVQARKLYGKIRRTIREDERYWQMYKNLRRIKSRFFPVSGKTRKATRIEIRTALFSCSITLQI